MKETQAEEHVVEPEREPAASNIFNILSIIQILRSASDALFAQANLHRQLAKVEWEEEKRRLSQIFTISLFGFGCFICLLIFMGLLVLALSWDTDYRMLSIVLLCVLYGLGAYFSRKQFLKLVKRPERFFANTRQEIIADIDMIRKKL